jgi:hypothetical protein
MSALASLRARFRRPTRDFAQAVTAGIALIQLVTLLYRFTRDFPKVIPSIAAVISNPWARGMAGTAFVCLLGQLLFVLRRTSLRAYAYIEIISAVLCAYVACYRISQNDVGTWGAVFGALYFVVRGRVNLYESYKLPAKA